MTERKPPGMSFETWVDQQIREAQERGEFDGLATNGQPLQGIDGPTDELWWVKAWLRREGISYVRPGLQLKKEVEVLVEQVTSAPSEAALRLTVAELNERIVHANKTTISGPPSSLMPLNVERLVERWRAARRQNR